MLLIPASHPNLDPIHRWRDGDRRGGYTCFLFLLLCTCVEGPPSQDSDASLRHEYQVQHALFFDRKMSPRATCVQRGADLKRITPTVEHFDNPLEPLHRICSFPFTDATCPLLPNLSSYISLRHSILLPLPPPPLPSDFFDFILSDQSLSGRCSAS
jgi:hypothetical protein